MNMFVFLVSSPHLTPTTGTLEVLAVDFADAVTQMAERCPGIHIIEFQFEYDPDTIARA